MGQDPTKIKKPAPSVLGSLATLGGLGFTIAVPMALGTLGGQYLDGRTHTAPLFLLLGLLLGLTLGVIGAYRLLKFLM